MSCRSCGSKNDTILGAEMNIHFPGREGLDQPSVWTFPKIMVCLDCGFTELKLQEKELAALAEGTRGSKPSSGQKRGQQGPPQQDCS